MEKNIYCCYFVTPYSVILFSCMLFGGVFGPLLTNKERRAPEMISSFPIFLFLYGPKLFANVDQMSQEFTLRYAMLCYDIDCKILFLITGNLIQLS